MVSAHLVQLSEFKLFGDRRSVLAADLEVGGDRTPPHFGFCCIPCS
ncbi:hypothetical protein NG799_23235 [Laspinema sp. D1]|uniref:Uncharacterized protein n=1 Tax=Laspinema palackyanum D2a TaxID=2953684 RepID=A0ABT2MWW2_9CYAN|nr:hypothetical protein [Laspinema sp. D2a]